MTGSIPGPRDQAPATTDQDAEHVQAAARLRRQRPRRVIVWAAPMRRYTAAPLFPAPRGTRPTAQTPGELAAQMDQVEQAARRPRARSRRLDAPLPREHEEGRVVQHPGDGNLHEGTAVRLGMPIRHEAIHHVGRVLEAVLGR